MRLFVFRHAFAGPTNNDPKKERERPLLPEGRAVAKAIALALLEIDQFPKTLFCSPFQRAIDTADIIGKTLTDNGPKRVQVNVINDLSPVRPVVPGLKSIVGYEDLKRVGIVGHVDNTTPAFKSLKSDDKWVDLVMGECRLIEIDRKDLSWKLVWTLKPSDLGLKDRES